jgi:signal peptidase I
MFEAQASSRLMSLPARSTPARPPLLRRLFAVLLSLLVPGFGQIYSGWAIRGLIVFAVALLFPALGIQLAVVTRSVAVTIGVVVVGFLITIFAIVDAFRIAGRPEGLQRSPLNRWYVALGLAIPWLLFAVPLWESIVKIEIGEAYRVRSVAMAPTLMDGDYVLAGRKRDPVRHGNIVVFQQGVAENAAWYTLRVIGLSNDTVEMRNGRLLLNGQPRQESDTWPATENWVDDEFRWQRSALLSGADSASYEASMQTWGPLVVPPKNMFLMGDNRGRSRDSRFIGFVDTGWVWGDPRLIYFSWDSAAARVRWERIGLQLR